MRVVSATFLGLPARKDVAEVPDHRIVSGGDQCRHVQGSFRTWQGPPHTLRYFLRIPLPRLKSATPTKGRSPHGSRRLFLDEHTYLPPPPEFPPANIQVMVPDVDDIWELAKEKGGIIVNPIEDRRYGLRDFTRTASVFASVIDSALNSR